MKLSIFAKVLIAMLVMFTVATFVFFTEASRTGKELLLALSHARAQSIADMGLMTLEHQMVEDEQSEILLFLRSLSSSHNTRCVCVFDTTGAAVFSMNPALHTEGLDLKKYAPHPMYPEHLVRRIDEGDKQFERYLWRLENDTQCQPCHVDEVDFLGYLGVEVPLNDLMEFAKHHKKTNIVMTIGVFTGLGACITLALLVLVIRPIRKLQHQIRTIESHIPELRNGKLLPPVSEMKFRTQDEVISLASSFQLLVTQLNTAYGEILELHDQQLERADQLSSVGEMAASIAHEIKNPVSGVKAALQIFLKSAKEDDERKEILEEMVVQLDRINKAVNDLLAYAREAPLKLRAISVNDVIDRTASMLVPEIEHRNIIFNLRLTTSHDIIQADEQQLQQVLWNIMINGIQSMQAGGTLDIITISDQDSFEIRISDTGKGIAPENMEKIFKPFFTTKSKGTGLGMTIVRRIVHQHGGELILSSEVNKGTTVQLRFPLNNATEE